MADGRTGRIFTSALEGLRVKGILKGPERILTGFLPPSGDRGPRCLLEGEGEKPFLRMNSNSYLGLSMDAEVIAAGEAAARRYGAGPGGVRFISGTCRVHVELEERLAAFHGREGAMIFSAAYAAVVGVLPPLVTKDTAVFSDALNHNCIINALRVARPAVKTVYPHLDSVALEKALDEQEGKVSRAVVVTDGVFSMRGDHAPLDRIVTQCRAREDRFPEGVLTVVDDSHGVGALGRTGRGTEERTGARADVLVATLGKALGVNGGYAASTASAIAYLRETAPSYVYSNPITPSEAAAAIKALEILESPRGADLLGRLDSLTARLRRGMTSAGFETLPGEHPIVPLMVRDTARTSRLVSHLYRNGILATGLNYPVVPKGDEEIRFQVSASHTEGDMDFVIDSLRRFEGK